jgi:hypothetical protein
MWRALLESGILAILKIWRGVTVTSGNINKLVALLKTEEEGEAIAALLNEFIIEDIKKNTLLVRLNEIRSEVAVLGQEITLTEAEEEIRTIVLAEKKPIIAEAVAKKNVWTV